MSMTFAQIHWWFFAIPFVGAVLLYRRYWYKPVTYLYPLTSYIKAQVPTLSLFPWYIVNGLRIAIFTLLLFLLAKPQFADHTQTHQVEGIDIMLVLDVSASMTAFDDVNTGRSRIEIAKEEAIRFIQKRVNDQIGLVIFGLYVISRCPLTMDKKIISDIVQEVTITQDDLHRSTHLAEAIAVGVQRLQHAKSKSKIMILLTDGQPAPDDTTSMQDAVTLAAKFGVKIYAIGIGSNEKPAYVHSSFGMALPMQTAIDKQLLQAIAKHTGGKAFFAEEPDDLRSIYTEIDTLEKTAKEETVHYQYYDWFMPLLWVLALLIGLELVGSLVWLIL